MTLIAHGVLALNKAVKERRFEKSKISEKKYEELSEEIEKLKTFFKQNGETKRSTEGFLNFLDNIRKAFETISDNPGIRVYDYEENLSGYEKFFQEEMLDDFKKDFLNSEDIQKRIINITKQIDELGARYVKRENKLGKATRKLRDLRRVESNMDVWGVDLGALAFEGVIAKVAYLPLKGAIKGVTALKDMVEAKKIEAARKAKAKADEEEKFKAQLAENAAKRAVKKQVDAETGVFVDLIKKSSAILYRKPGEKDMGAFHAGLLHHADTDQENIIQIDDDHIAFVYDFGDGKGKELNVFFINHETGNMEQISQIKSKDGIKIIELALANRKVQIAEKAKLMDKRRSVNIDLKGRLANNDLHK